ncbi:hypothetical protein F01_460642 [Burkholderia cenocepacia]|nr:hypothetical protein F01_460642 [Burkholderia cenocepacia]
MRNVDPRLGRDAAVGLQHAAVHAFGERGRGVADIDLAARDVEWPAIEGKRARDAEDGVLRGRVRDCVRARTVGGDRTVVDDAPALRRLTLHLAPRGAGAQEHAGQVGRDQVVPELQCVIVDRHGAGVAARVVEQHVKAPERVCDLCEARVDRCFLGHVGRNCRRHAPGPLDDLLRPEERIDAPAEQRDAETCLRERYRSGLSDAGAGARYCRDFFLCLHFHDLVFGSLSMTKALRGGDAAAILIRSININCPVLTGASQGFPEFVAVPRACCRGLARRGYARRRSGHPAARTAARIC